MKKILILSVLVLVTVLSLPGETIVGQMVTSIDENDIATFGEYWIELVTEEGFISRIDEQVFGDAVPTPEELVPETRELYLFRLWYLTEGADPELLREEYAVATDYTGYQRGYTGTMKHWSVISWVATDTYEVSSWVNLVAPDGLDDSAMIIYERTNDAGELSTFTFFGHVEGEFFTASGDAVETSDQ